MCLYPTLIKNRKYLPNKKNRGTPPRFYDERVQYVAIGCLQCIECRKQKMNGWKTRLMEDIKEHTNGKFITLTFNTESLNKIAETRTDGNVPITELLEGYALDNFIATRAMRLFLEKWRKKFGKSLRHFAVTELGHKNTEHVHIHAIVWTNESFETITERWGMGYVYPNKDQKKYNYVSERTINYISKYIMKQDLQHKDYTPVILCSPGIGKRYTTTHNYRYNKFNEKETNELYTTGQGHKLSLPIYYRNKRYTEEEREKLWIHRLNKEERYILGQKVSIKNGYNAYDKMLEEARIYNKQMKYGSNEINWSRKAYELHRRNLIHQTRIKIIKAKYNPIYTPTPKKYIEPKYSNKPNAILSLYKRTFRKQET